MFKNLIAWSKYNYFHHPRFLRTPSIKEIEAPKKKKEFFPIVVVALLPQKLISCFKWINAFWCIIIKQKQINNNSFYDNYANETATLRRFCYLSSTIFLLQLQSDLLTMATIPFVIPFVWTNSPYPLLFQRTPSAFSGQFCHLSLHTWKFNDNHHLN